MSLNTTRKQKFVPEASMMISQRSYKDREECPVSGANSSKSSSSLACQKISQEAFRIAATESPTSLNVIDSSKKKHDDISIKTTEVIIAKRNSFSCIKQSPSSSSFTRSSPLRSISASASFSSYRKKEKTMTKQNNNNSKAQGGFIQSLIQRDTYKICVFVIMLSMIQIMTIVSYHHSKLTKHYVSEDEQNKKESSMMAVFGGSTKRLRKLIDNNDSTTTSSRTTEGYMVYSSYPTASLATTTTTTKNHSADHHHYPRIILAPFEVDEEATAPSSRLRGYNSVSEVDENDRDLPPIKRVVEPMSSAPVLDDDAWTSPITCPDSSPSQESTCSRPNMEEVPPIVNCGDMHGLDLYQSVIDGALMNTAEDSRFTAQPLARGGTRQVWKLRDQSDDSTYVLKTLLLERPFDAFDYEMQRIDALAMERLTKSRYTVDIYGFCGQSTINEFATKVGSKIFKDKHLTDEEKLRFATDIAQGVADVQSIANESSSSQLAFIHNDISSSNFVLVDPNGPIKLNDFNVAQLQCWDSKGGEPCGYYSPEQFGGEGLRRVDVRAPEEFTGQVLTEKIDVYGVGSILYFLLTGKRMYALEEKELNDEEKRNRILESVLPSLPSGITDSESKEVQAIRHAMTLALKSNPNDRPTAQELADTLNQASSVGGLSSNVLNQRTASGQPQDSPSIMFVAGLVRDVKMISSKVMDQVVELNCKYGIGVHLLADTGPNLLELENRRHVIDAGNGSCAPFIVLLRNHQEDMLQFPNRIERIAHLRDVQRDHLNDFLVKSNANLKTSAIMLLDFDLSEIPSNEILVDEFFAMEESDEHDVVCAGGRMHNPPGYYDTFATILFPNTFVYPIEGRLIDKMMPGENRAFIRSGDAFGEFTQKDLMDHFEEQAKEYPQGTVPVRSCFGGLAIYRASTWLTPTCRYTLDSKDIMGYANNGDGRPCEHVVFHNCLFTADPSTYVAVKPELVTYWDKAPLETNTMKSNGQIFTGLDKNNGLVTLVESPSEGTRLVNGKYVARIDDSGSLVVERHNEKADPSAGSVAVDDQIWKAGLDLTRYQDHWKKAFLILESNGLLKVIHQVTGIKPDMNTTDCIEVNARNTTLGILTPFDPRNTLCRVEVWNSGKVGLAQSTHIVELGDDGVLSVKDTEFQRVVWSSREGWESEHQTVEEAQNQQENDLKRPCIPSGDESGIMEALSYGPGSEAVLCQGAVIDLKSTIKIIDNYQKIYTEGHPTDDEHRALLRVADPSVVTAISIKGTNHTEIRNLIIDGNRPEYGHVLPNILQDTSGGLIVAGGVAHDQIVSNVKAYEPRSWSCLQVQEGLDDQANACRDVLVENNELGPAGRDSGTHNPIADGISFACLDGIVRNNTVIDATDGGIVIFGAPGTIVENNVVIARSKNLLGGINLVDRAPYNGNYAGTVVRNNLIKAEGSMINIGLGMGLRIWTCQSQSVSSDEFLFGGTVTNNRLEGDWMGYGYAISGVKNWTARGNIDVSKHQGIPLADCNGQIPSPPEGFQIDSLSSNGSFQTEFQEAKLDSITLTFLEKKSQHTSRKPHSQQERPNSNFWMRHRHLPPISHVDPVLQVGHLQQQEQDENLSPSSSCIPSGDGNAINAALTKAGDEAVLCPGAVFDVTVPIEFTRDDQKIYTQGFPTDETRAVLRVADPSIVTAISMIEVSGTELKNVIVDGNRQNLGYVSPSEVSFSSGALIAAGGNGVSGTIISGVHAFDPRSWACLQVQEGDLSFRCERVTVEDNHFGPTGPEAGGLSFACPESSVRNNIITDTTDTGISIAGAPGTIFENNKIVSNNKNNLRVGIAMVDYNPFGGDYTNTIVRKNIIQASEGSGGGGGTIGVGIAMGTHVWGCPSEDQLPLFGAKIIENQLEGLSSNMGYGYVISGVKDWTVQGNHNQLTPTPTDETSSSPPPPTIIKHQSPCNADLLISSPSEGGFQVSTQFSFGNFQDEFIESSNLDGIVKSLVF